VREGLELSPDMVMVSFFIGNDFDGRTRSLLSYSYALSFFKYAADRFSKFEDRTAVHKTRSYDDNGPDLHGRRLSPDRAHQKLHLSRRQQPP
ncbi:MAG: hypothetical protein QOG83_1113, partial [Alphaproteobacteria bacterium]|nr:hypothetical protein [Alphaproteobacteria bacterium]